MNFLALVIISDFDEYYVSSLESDANFQLIQDDADGILAKALKIQVTTSNEAEPQVDGNRIEKETMSDSEGEQEKEPAKAEKIGQLNNNAAALSISDVTGVIRTQVDDIAKKEVKSVEKRREIEIQKKKEIG